MTGRSHDIHLALVILNKRSLMVLPRGVNKASGLRDALDELGIAPEDTVGVGDAENDEAFLALCGYSAAVANALPKLRCEGRWGSRANTPWPSSIAAAPPPRTSWP